jgi:hypothetical protein
MKSNLLLVILIICNLFSNSLFAQHEYFSTIKFNVPIGGGGVKNSGGLEVKSTLTGTRKVSSQQATLYGQPNRFIDKYLFTLFITVINTGQNEIIISDWEFRAICPENLHGQQWQEHSFINLITPVIPNAINILLKPGEKKSFFTNETDFFWCSPMHQEALKTNPCGITALIICKQVGSQIYNNGLTNDFSGNNCKYENYKDSSSDGGDEEGGSDEFSQSKDKDNSGNKNQEKPTIDSELLALIEEFKKAKASGNTDEADEFKKTILEIAGHAYPDKLNEINGMLGITQVEPARSNVEPIKPILAPVEPINKAPIKTITPDQNTEYSDWGTVKNPYYSMQVRYKLEKKEGDVNYYKAQLRVNFEDPSRIQTARCLGYVVCFGIPTLDGLNYNYLHYEFFYSYKEIYTMPDLIPMKMSFPDGSKRMLKKEGFYYKAKDSNQEIYFAYFDKSVDLILNGYPITCKNFIESKAIILK